MKNSYLLCCLISLLWSCGSNSKPESQLPIHGVRDFDEKGDTIFHTIGDFSFVNQDSQIIGKEDFMGKIYVADFFFTNCPSICPNMTAQLYRVHEKFKSNPNVLLLSHSIDTMNDSVSVLKDYADKLGVSSKKWQFITGNREDIYSIAKNKYYISAMVDESAPGGYLHNSKFILVDSEGRIRGYYTGTEQEDVDRMMVDMEKLLAK